MGDVRMVRSYRRQVGVLATFFVLALVIGLAISTPGEVVEASAEEATYSFSDLSVDYPYEDPRTGAMDPTRASVSYRSNWATSEYPGLTACQFVLKDASGAVVGTHRFDLSSISPDLPHPVSSDPIVVSRAPATAEGSCEGGSYSEAADYRFSQPTITPRDGGARLSFDVDWEGHLHPAGRSCTVVVSYEDGSRRELGPFSVHLSQSEPFEFDVVSTDDARRIQDATVDCVQI